MPSIEQSRKPMADKMTIKEFCRITDWPEEELSEMPLADAEDLFALYGLQMVVEVDVRRFWLMIASIPKHKLKAIIDL